MDSQHSISVFNSLIEINNDRIEGYLTATKETKEAELIRLFDRMAETSHQNRIDLATEVLKLGGHPDETTRNTGKLFRLWMDIKASFAGNERHTILSSCEFGENAALEAYAEALTNHPEDLTSEQQALIKAQMSRIRLDHNLIKEMRDMSKELH